MRMQDIEKHARVWWGGRCPEFDPYCPACKGWKEVDKARQLNIGDEIRFVVNDEVVTDKVRSKFWHKAPDESEGPMVMTRKTRLPIWVEDLLPPSIFSGARIWERRLFRHTGAEGCKHDPYGWEERSVIVNGKDYTLRLSGLGYARLIVDGKQKMEGFEPMKDAHGKPLRLLRNGRRAQRATDAEVVGEWERLVKMDVGTFDKAYWRNYVEDPMGSPSMYI